MENKKCSKPPTRLNQGFWCFFGGMGLVVFTPRTEPNLFLQRFGGETRAISQVEGALSMRVVPWILHAYYYTVPKRLKLHPRRDPR